MSDSTSTTAVHLARVCCPFCGGRIRPEYEDQGAPYMSLRVVSGYECTGPGCSAVFDEAGQVAADPDWAMFPDMHPRPDVPTIVALPTDDLELSEVVGDPVIANLEASWHAGACGCDLAGGRCETFGARWTDHAPSTWMVDGVVTAMRDVFASNGAVGRDEFGPLRRQSYTSDREWEQMQSARARAASHAA